MTLLVESGRESCVAERGAARVSNPNEHLSRADWQAGKAGNEDCLLDEDDEPQVDELDLEAEEEQGCRTDWSTDLSEKNTVAKSVSKNTLIAKYWSLKERAFHRFCTRICQHGPSVRLRTNIED